MTKVQSLFRSCGPERAAQLLVAWTKRSGAQDLCVVVCGPTEWYRSLSQLLLRQSVWKIQWFSDNQRYAGYHLCHLSLNCLSVIPFYFASAVVLMGAVHDSPTTSLWELSYEYQIPKMKTTDGSIGDSAWWGRYLFESGRRRPTPDTLRRLTPTAGL